MKQNLIIGGILAQLMVNPVSSTTVQTTDAAELYACTDTSSTGVPEAGITVCDATGTPALARRSESDNLQSREGALVVFLEDDGVSAKAGLQPGDVLYRLGGVDVDTAETAAEILSRIGTRSDTIVNFLRDGRPYRVKLRRH